MPAETPCPVTGIVLAGGRGARFGGLDKGLLERNGRTLIANVLERLRPQVDQLLIVANRNADIYARLGVPVVADHLPDFQGPLAGIHAGLSSMAEGLALFVPVDAPNLPTDLATRLQQAGQLPAYVQGADGPVPVCCLMSQNEVTSIVASLLAGERSVIRWLRQRGATPVDFSDQPASDWSLNTPQELEAS